MRRSVIDSGFSSVSYSSSFFRYKLNISLRKLRINISDSRIITAVNVMDNLPFPRSHTVLDNTDDLLMFDHVS